MSFISRLLNRANPHADLEVKFHKDANHFGEHGQLKVTHVKQQLKGVNVRFVFPGLAEAPALTRVMLDHIWESARAQGYVPHELVAYGNENILIKNDSELKNGHGHLSSLEHDEARGMIGPAAVHGNEQIALARTGTTLDA